LVNRWLIHLTDDPASGAWLRLYKDPTDGRLWELTYPHSEMHGGGPRILRVITSTEAAQTFGWKNEV
ncbi:MAG: Imm27 family immunity protein, partial [Burkholderiales bacterium]